MSNKPEILAPVGGAEQLIAAVRCGADAVYFGLSNVNARRNAENFADEGLKDTIAYCHIHNVKVYITINILVKDNEILEMQKAVDAAALAGADALIVQDLAVLSYCKRCWPKLPLFASTQMVCHNEEGVRQLLEMGFSRIVLARELSLNEIKDIIEKTKAQTEVFVHGAHCMSLSGACYLSSMIGARSGNRGLCAQPCRLDWKCKGRNYALSLKDLSYVEHIKELSEIGVVSFKIEGRMKRAEYVAAAVTACKDALQGKKHDMETLRSVFSRSGFTDGHLMNKRNLEMFGNRTKEDVTAAVKVFKGLQSLYEKENQNIPIDMKLSISSNKPSKLTVFDGKNEVFALGDIPQKALTLPLNQSYAEKSLFKTGGTVYIAKSLKLEAEEGLMLASSSLNALRRAALLLLDQKRAEFSVQKEEIKEEIVKKNIKPLHPFQIRFENQKKHMRKNIIFKSIITDLEIIRNANFFRFIISPIENIIICQIQSDI